MTLWIRKPSLIVMLLALGPQACHSNGESGSAATVVQSTRSVESPPWVEALKEAVTRIDAEMPGEFGVYVHRLGDAGGTFDRGGGRQWYLSSTIKVPVAIAVLERVDAGDITLDETLTLAETDFVDGAGDMLRQRPGTPFSVATLIEKSIEDSDSTATDLLIRLIGEQSLNHSVRRWVGDGFGPITTILQVRYDAYGALNPDVEGLSNLDLLRVRQAGAGEARLTALARALGVPRKSLEAGSIEEVFERYYETGRNSARLDAFARLLEKLVTGELLSEESTARLLGHMRRISTGSRRIRAGLPPGADFAQKTGTQVARACNVGTLDPDRGEAGATIVVACAREYAAMSQAERAFQSLGRALHEAGLVQGHGSLP